MIYIIYHCICKICVEPNPTHPPPPKKKNNVLSQHPQHPYLPLKSSASPSLSPDHWCAGKEPMLAQQSSQYCSKSQDVCLNIWVPSQSLTARPWKTMVGRLLSFWEANFSGGYVKLQVGNVETPRVWLGYVIYSITKNLVGGFNQPIWKKICSSNWDHVSK